MNAFQQLCPTGQTVMKESPLHKQIHDSRKKARNASPLHKALFVIQYSIKFIQVCGFF